MSSDPTNDARLQELAEAYLDGDLTDLIEAVTSYYQAQQLRNATDTAESSEAPKPRRPADGDQPTA